MEFREKSQLAHPPNNQLRVLGTEIYYRYVVLVMHGEVEMIVNAKGKFKPDGEESLVTGHWSSVISHWEKKCFAPPFFLFTND